MVSHIKYRLLSSLVTSKKFRVKLAFKDYSVFQHYFLQKKKLNQARLLLSVCPAAPSGLPNKVLSNKHTVSAEEAAIAKIPIFLYIKKSKAWTFLNTGEAFSGAQKYLQNQGGKWHKTTPFLTETRFTDCFTVTEKKVYLQPSRCHLCSLEAKVVCNCDLVLISDQQLKRERLR